MTQIAFVATVGKGPISSAINIQTWSDKSHTLIWDQDSDLIIEALAHVPGEPWYKPGRVVKRTLFAYDGATLCYVYRPQGEFCHGIAWEFACDQVDKPYDFKGCARFVSRGAGRTIPSVEKWFCSELATAVARVGGGQVHWLPAYKVSPKLHAASVNFTEPEATTIERLQGVVVV